MPTRLYQVDPHVLRLDWEPVWRQMAVWFDNANLGVIPTMRDLIAGRTFMLPDGAELCIQITHPYRARDLIVSLNGDRLYGTDPSLPNVIRVTYQTVFVISGLFIFFGCIGLFAPSDVLLAMGIGQHSLIIGTIFLLLGFFVRRRSLVALILATAMLGAHWLIGISFGGVLGNISHVGGSMFHLMLGIPLARGVFAFDAWTRQFPPVARQTHVFWRNVVILAGILLLPFIVFVIALFWFYPG